MAERNRGIDLATKRWVRDAGGTAHAARRSEGEHHSAYCGKYLRGPRIETRSDGRVPGQCRDCLQRLLKPLVPPPEIPESSRAEALGKISCDRHWNGGRFSARV